MKYYLAIDIGASSGRHIVGYLKDNKIITDEVYRFNNGNKKQNGHLIWDINAIYENVVKGIEVALNKYSNIESLAIDTWGCDYVLLTNNGELLPCLSYRDLRTKDIIDEVHKLISFENLYELTGIQFQPFNTIYQLYDDKKRKRLDMATDFLMIPEYLSYKLTGNKVKEYTNATTTGLVNAKTKEFDEEIINKLGLKKELFRKLVQPKELIGYYKNIKVICCASHDSASAVEGITLSNNDIYISSGTWSLLGIKTTKAITDNNSKVANYSNEGGINYIRYQKNIMGMWVVNKLKEELCPDISFDKIIKQAKESKINEIVDLNEQRFLSPTSMKEEIDKSFDRKIYNVADYFKIAFLSLAHCYKKAIDQIEYNTHKKYENIYIVGGGAKNKYLNELTQIITNKKVNALAIEATAIGNLKIQMEAANELK